MLFSLKGSKTMASAETWWFPWDAAVLFSILYLIIRSMLHLVPSAEEGREREVEILVLRHQVKVLARKAGRPKFRRLDRLFLSAAGRMLRRERGRLAPT